MPLSAGQLAQNREAVKSILQGIKASGAKSSETEIPVTPVEEATHQRLTSLREAYRDRVAITTGQR